MANNIHRFNQLNRQLYCFADSLELCRKLLDGGALVVQLRNKVLPRAELLQLAQGMARSMRDYPDALLIVNDYMDIALQSGAHGVHLGQQDDNYRQVLDQAPPGFIVGVSVASVAEAQAAEAAGATYVGAGAVYATDTKADAAVIGLDGLRAIVAAVRIPVVAIGGVNLTTLSAVARTGVPLFAVISDINDAKDVAARVRQLNQHLESLYHE